MKLLGLKRKTKFILGPLFTAGSVLAFSNQALAIPLTLLDAIHHAQELSPDIRSFENQIESTEAKSRQALAPTEPNLSVIYNDMTQAWSPSLSSSTVFQLNQPFGFPGKALLNRASLVEQANSLRSQLRATQLQVATNVKTAYYQLALAQKNIQINREQKDFYERFIAIAKRRYESGSITEVDFLNSKISLYTNDNDLADLQSNLRATRAQLNVLMFNPVETEIEVEAIRRPNLSPIIVSLAQEKMLAQRPEILSASHQAQAADKNKTLAWMSLLPDFQLTAGTTFYNVPSASPLSATPGAQVHTFLVGLQITLPIWFLFNDREGIVASSHDQAAAEANLTSVLNQSKSLLESTLANLEAMITKIANYESNLVPLAKQSLDLALVSYSAGKIDYLTLASTAMAWRNTQRDYYAIIVNYLIGIATYGQIVGEDL